MKVRSTKLAVETLEDRCVPATVAYADFNKDGLMDMAAITAPTTVAVSLANPDGSYTVSAILSVPKSQPMVGLWVDDFDRDGDLDVRGSGANNAGWYSHTWSGEGDGTFGSRNFEQAKFPKRWV